MTPKLRDLRNKGFAGIFVIQNSFGTMNYAIFLKRKQKGGVFEDKRFYCLLFSQIENNSSWSANKNSLKKEK